MSLITRELNDTEQVIAFMASNIVGGQHASVVGTDLPKAVGTAIRICNEIASRVDHPETFDDRLPVGTLELDQSWTQRNDGSDKRVSLCVTWAEETKVDVKMLEAMLGSVVSAFAKAEGHDYRGAMPMAPDDQT